MNLYFWHRLVSPHMTALVCALAKAGHKDWEKLLLRKNLDKETDQAWGDILDNL